MTRRFPAMTRRTLVSACLATLLLAAPAAGEDIVGKKRTVDARIAQLHGHIAETREREEAIRDEIVEVTGRIRTLEAQVGDVSARLSTLEEDLALHRERLDRLNALFQAQSERLQYLRQQYATAVERLNRRLVEIYESDDADTLSVVLSARSIDDFLDQLDFVKQIGALDRRIAASVHETKTEVAAARRHTAATRGRVAAAARAIEVRASQVRAARDRLVSAQDALSDTRRDKQVNLAALSAEERAELEEVQALEVDSAALAAKIRAAQAPASSGTPAATGNGTFIWPVNGPVTSPFGMRWGRLHAGIDIGAGMGTPIHAAGSGTVIYSGWMGGYGNLVVIDHGNGLATAYAHQSSIAVGVGQAVAQGDTIGYVGSTGHSFGPHLHFEVRVNGAAVDPLGYL
jgi:murein DD-endopeptidase MepM/ murein hydrolase activator NlpD